MPALFTYSAIVTRVVDGDTLDLRLDLGFKVGIDIRTRLIGIDTPEVFGVTKDSEEYKRGKAASDFADEWINAFGDNTKAGRRVTVQTHKNPGDKYGRWLARVTSPEHADECLNDALVEAGHARPIAY